MILNVVLVVLEVVLQLLLLQLLLLQGPLRRTAFHEELPFLRQRHGCTKIQ